MSKELALSLSKGPASAGQVGRRAGRGDAGLGGTGGCDDGAGTDVDREGEVVGKKITFLKESMKHDIMIRRDRRW